MVYVAVDYDGSEVIVGLETKYSYMLEDKRVSLRMGVVDAKVIAKGSIEKLIGKKITWEDEPVELKEELWVKLLQKKIY